MRKKLPIHREKRIRYPFSLWRRIVDGHLIWFECYKLIEEYDIHYHKWIRYKAELDDRKNYVDNKEESKTFGGPY